jgi:hypothetical protein
MKKTSLMNVPATFESMAQSSFFLVLGVGDVVQEIRDKEDCYQQIRMARALKKPVVLMLDRQLRPLEQEELYNCLEGLEIIGTVSFDSEKMDDRVKDELGDLLAGWKKKRGVHNS